MFKDSTVFIVGAGASYEFDMPLGAHLAKTISSNLEWLSRDVEIYGRLRDKQTNSLIQHYAQTLPREQQDEVYQAARLIHEGIDHAMSIDAFIDMHADKPLVGAVGKLQIALEILRAENNSKLALPRSSLGGFDWEMTKDSWLRVFSEILLEKSKSSAIDSIAEDLTIICFNYDRCIEHYLTYAVQRTFGIDWQEAYDHVSKIRIIHPYGDLGPLKSGATSRNSFGSLEGVDFWMASQRLSTFTEEVRDQDSLKEIRSAIASAHQLVFLGFSFQPQNMALLRPDSDKRERKRRPAVYASAMGFHDVAKAEIVRRIRDVLRYEAHHLLDIEVMIDTTAYDLMRFNRLNLARS
ncbi:SIR2 family protein [Devosia sp. XGJD_8]|uniref:SIR2 family protein n=1 Tax=Devosia sp. XGJD_8 TaxID=3391187 RepID=UPI0039846BA0